MRHSLAREKRFGGGGGGGGGGLKEKERARSALTVFSSLFRKQLRLFNEPAGVNLAFIICHSSLETQAILAPFVVIFVSSLDHQEDEIVRFVISHLVAKFKRTLTSASPSPPQLFHSKARLSASAVCRVCS